MTNVGEGYRQLEPGEVIQEGDQYCPQRYGGQTWFWSRREGEVFSGSMPYRRPLSRQPVEQEDA